MGIVRTFQNSGELWISHSSLLSGGTYRSRTDPNLNNNNEKSSKNGKNLAKNEEKKPTNLNNVSSSKDQSLNHVSGDDIPSEYRMYGKSFTYFFLKKNNFFYAISRKNLIFFNNYLPHIPRKIENSHWPHPNI